MAFRIAALLSSASSSQLTMSNRILNLICRNDLSAEKQQEIVGLIGSASKAEVEFKVTPKQQHLSLFIVFDLGLIARFHFFPTLV